MANLKVAAHHLGDREFCTFESRWHHVYRKDVDTLVYPLEDRTFDSLEDVIEHAWIT